VFNQYGADAIRLYLMNSPVVEADDLRFSEKGVELILRQVLIPLWNSYLFLETYAQIYAWKPHAKSFERPEAEIDRWILSLLQKLVLESREAMDGYRLSQAVKPFVSFIEQLTNWYIRRSRSRFWSDVASSDRDQAFETLYTVMLTLVKVLAPFLPFLSDEIYRQLRMDTDPISVHLADYPKVELSLRIESLEKKMADVQSVVSLGHALRKTHKLKVRQPLQKAHVIASDPDTLQGLRENSHLIADELNVKLVEYHEDETAFVALSVKPNFRVLGKKVGPLMAATQKAIQGFSQRQLKTLLAGDNITVEVEGQSIVLTPEDLAVERKVLEGIVALTEGSITVALDTALTEELLIEGLARELINKINTMRRDEGYAVTDRIEVTLQTTDRVKEMFAIHKVLICGEVLATHVHFKACTGSEWDLNGEMTVIAISKA
jgi:isoleucyl-tRNA synthetase